MKILQVVHSFPPYTTAGTEVYAYALSKELLRRNHKVFVFFRVNNPQEKEYSLSCNNLEGIETYTINNTFNRCGSFKNTYDNSIIDKIFGEVLDKIKPDIMHIQHLLFLSLGLVEEAKKRKIPIIFTINDYWLFCHKGQLIQNNLAQCQIYNNLACRKCLISQLSIRKNVIFFYNSLRRNVPNMFLQLIKNIYFTIAKILFLKQGKLEKEIEKRYDYAKQICEDINLFIAPSRYIKDRFIAFGIPEKQISICGYGLQQPAIFDVTNSTPHSMRFGYIGTLLPLKGPDVVISAFRKIKEQNVELLIYGKLVAYAGYESYLKKIKKIVSQDKRIRLMGSFDNSNIGRVMDNVDILVVPSIWQENSPLVIQEAFLYRRPVIASNIGGMPELITDGVNGFLVVPGNIDDLKKKMEYIIHNPEVIARFQNNLPRIKSIEDNAKEMKELYSRLLNEEGR